jgi:ParB-like chromosome segregation protein Spo0J
MAARHLGMETVPVVLADEWTDAQVKAFRIAVNKSAELAEWDTDLLKLELQELEELDFDLELTGFELPEVEDILDTGGNFDPDENAEVPHLDETQPKTATCPHCGHVFELKE